MTICIWNDIYNTRTFKNDVIKMCIYSIMILCAHPWLLVSVFCIKRSFKDMALFKHATTLISFSPFIYCIFT